MGYSLAVGEETSDRRPLIVLVGIRKRAMPRELRRIGNVLDEQAEKWGIGGG